MNTNDPDWLDLFVADMRSVWLENILVHRPKRWLPEKYSKLRTNC
jgi:hypothetical protein